MAVVPCIAREVLPGLTDALRACPTPDVLLLTSVHAARCVAEAARSSFQPRRVAVVGPATAEGARAAGFTVHVEPDRPTGVAAVAALGDLQGLTVLYARAETSVAATTEALDASGATVVHAVAYRTVAAPDLAAALAAAGPVDHALFFSPSAVHAYVDACAHPLTPRCMSALAIGPTTARACEAAGLTVLATAAHADLVATLTGLS